MRRVSPVAEKVTEAILQTQRLWLREFERGDAQALFRLNRDPEITRYTGDRAFDSRAAALAFIDAYDHYRLHGYGRWALLLRSNDEFIGWCGLKRHPDGMVDIGFRLFRSAWGHGYATEAARAVLAYAVEDLGLREVVGRAATANLASVRILEKLGMEYWKAAPCDGIADAVYYRYRP